MIPICCCYTLSTVAIGPALIALPKLVAFAGALAASAVLLWIVSRTDLGRAIRAVAKEKQGARLMGIDVDHVYAMSFGIGLGCVGAAACFLLPAYYVNPQVGAGFVLVAFTIVVLGGMGSQLGVALAAVAMIGGAEILRELDFLKTLFGSDFDPNQYRMLLFGLAMVAMMIWKPRGFVSARTPTIFLAQERAVAAALVKEGRG